jgi:hypothetical protein
VWRCDGDYDFVCLLLSCVSLDSVTSGIKVLVLLGGQAGIDPSVNGS